MNFLNNLKLKSKIIIQTSIIGGTVLIMGILMTFTLNQQKNSLEQDLTASMARSKAIVDFSLTAKDISQDVVQVQQWLTDISATRAQDGLNDGFDEAANNAAKFKVDISKALRISQDLHLSEASASLKNIQDAFPSYYDTGSKMAQSYIDEGPASGNKMMAEFDTAAERISSAVTELLEIADLELEKQNAAMSESMENVSASLTSVGVFNIIGIFIVLVIAASSVYLIQKIVGSPLSDLNILMLRLANGEDDLAVPESDRTDEIGEMAGTLQIFQDKSRENKRLEEENRIATEAQQAAEQDALEKEEQRRRQELDKEQAELAEKEARTNRISELISNFENNITEITTVMAAASTEMSSTAEQMVETSNDTKERSSNVSVASDETSKNVNMVASAAEELSSSVQEIGRQALTASEISQEAVLEAGKSESAISALSEASEKINEVIGIISDIAEQTNLLALNATIESARAGEAGRGFAVVANEVKALASQTSNATSQISSQILEMQNLTTTAVESIKNIVDVNNRSNKTTSIIQETIEQQNNATDEISQNIQRVATGTAEVSNNISRVAKGAEQTGHAGEEVLTTANELSQISDNLKKDIEQFLADVRAV